jgi:hypothetical protein
MGKPMLTSRSSCFKKNSESPNLQFKFLNIFRFKKHAIYDWLLVLIYKTSVACAIGQVWTGYSTDFSLQNHVL